MTPAATIAHLSAAGVELYIDHGKLRFRAPAGAFTDELRSLAAANRADLIAHLSAVPCTRCGSTETADFSIHDGQSIRRDCAKCGRFQSFPLWYGRKGRCDA